MSTNLSRREYLSTSFVGIVTAGTAGCTGRIARLTAPKPAGEAEPVHMNYELSDVDIMSTDGERLGSVTVALATDSDTRYLGLSATPELPENRGMLFIYESESDLTFVMRDMDYGIDIVFVDSDGVITKIHHAPSPEPDEDGADQEYSGYGQYVLEVNKGWTTDRDIKQGDVLSSPVIDNN